MEGGLIIAVENIEKRLERLELELERAKAVIECQNLISRVSWLHTIGIHSGPFLENFTSHTPGAKEEMTWGVYEGMNAAEKAAKDHIEMEGEGDSREPGQLHMHTLTTPVIEVAADGETARGIWISPGLETGRFDGELKALWCWVKYAADFIKEDGKWKIWHHHVYDLFSCPYDKSWVEANQNTDFSKIDIKESEWANRNRPDRPPTTQWIYGPDAIYPTDQPSVPLPYETWDDCMSCVK